MSNIFFTEFDVECTNNIHVVVIKSSYPCGCSKEYPIFTRSFHLKEYELCLNVDVVELKCDNKPNEYHKTIHLKKCNCISCFVNSCFVSSTSIHVGSDINEYSKHALNP